MERRTIGVMLADARARLRRLTPIEAATAIGDGWILIDTRDGDVRSRDGTIPGAIHVPLSVLEWRVDPTSEYPDPVLASSDGRFILVCEHGYSSSLAAVRLQELGFRLATDVIGGFEAWAAAGLPVTRDATMTTARTENGSATIAPSDDASISPRRRTGPKERERSDEGSTSWDR
ncbi:MAG: rhodanese-like domain-containing protein [Candidatus Limnocylindria bacterium]